MTLLLRVISGALLLAIVAGALWLGVVPLAILVGAASLLAAWEFASLAAKNGTPPPAWLLYPLTLWLAVRTLLPAGYTAADWALYAAVVVGLLVSVLTRTDLRRWAMALGGACWLGLSLSAFVALYQWHGSDPNHLGLRLVALAVLGVAAGDTTAYFTGSALGRHRFFPSISPRKSVEGAVAGLAASVLVGSLAGPALVGISPWLGLGLGLLIAVASQGGDLVESSFKRQAGVKDSSRLIPGHGGLLDRMDSLVLVGPVVYCYLKLIAFP